MPTMWGRWRGVVRCRRPIAVIRSKVIFFRDSDRVAICGDVIRNFSYATYRPMLAEPPEIFVAALPA